MPAVRDTMKLHRETIEAAERHTKKKKSGPHKSSRVITTSVDLRVWQTALEIAEGNRSRIKVISPTEVIVLNP